MMRLFEKLAEPCAIADRIMRDDGEGGLRDRGTRLMYEMYMAVVRNRESEWRGAADVVSRVKNTYTVTLPLSDSQDYDPGRLISALHHDTLIARLMYNRGTPSRPDFAPGGLLRITSDLTFSPDCATFRFVQFQAEEYKLLNTGGAPQ